MLFYGSLAIYSVALKLLTEDPNETKNEKTFSDLGSGFVVKWEYF